MGIDDWIAALAARALGERMLVQIREKAMDRQQLQHLLSRALARAEPFGSRVVVNSDCGAFPQCDGVHLTSKALMAASRAARAARWSAPRAHDERRARAGREASASTTRSWAR